MVEKEDEIVDELDVEDEDTTENSD
jgi:hypothetical protein